MKSIISNLKKMDKAVFYVLIFSIFMAVMVAITKLIGLPEGHGYMFVVICFIILGLVALVVIFRDIVEWVISFIKR